MRWLDWVALGLLVIFCGLALRLLWDGPAPRAAVPCEHPSYHLVGVLAVDADGLLPVFARSCISD